MIGLTLAFSPSPPQFSNGGVDAAIDAAVKPIADVVSSVIFFSIQVGDTPVQLVVVWLMVAATFFTFYFRFINLRGFTESLRIVTGKRDREGGPGEVSHFQALTAAVSGTVGVGNVAHVAIAVSIGGPGAAFWLFVAGFLGMSSKFVECTLGVKYRQQNADGTVSGGPMFYLDRGLAERGWPRFGKLLARFYALCIILGCLGVGCMFQSNQAFVQFVTATGGERSLAVGSGWAFGIGLAVLTALVIIGGIKSIGRVTAALVPVMALLYIGMALVVIGAHYERIPWAIQAIVSQAFSPEGVTGGAFAVAMLGFRRAAFSNEAGIGSAAIAHSAVRTQKPVTQGFVALLEPFIDTMVICMLTALIIVVAGDPGAHGTGVAAGVEMTSKVVGGVVSWFPSLLTVVIFLFAYSTLISWSYYGLAGSVYLFGPGRSVKFTFNLIFCVFVVIGSSAQLSSILDFSDSMVFAMAFANIIGLYMLAPVVKRELDEYWSQRASP